ncbi:MAG: hypothetical protein RI958_1978 [Actinomycetota bacterium]
MKSPVHGYCRVLRITRQYDRMMTHDPWVVGSIPTRPTRPTRLV